VKIVEPLIALVTRIPVLGELFLAFGGLLEDLIKDARAGEGGGLDSAEQRIEVAADLLACAGLAEVLSAHRPVVEEVQLEGARYRRMTSLTQGVYFGRRGQFEVERHLFRQVGVRNGPTIVPMEQRAGIVGGRWTPSAAAAAAHLLQTEPSRDAVQTCKALGVMPFSRSSLVRSGELLGERWESLRPEAEDELAPSVSMKVRHPSPQKLLSRVTHGTSRSCLAGGLWIWGRVRLLSVALIKSALPHLGPGWGVRD
jgi:hypothetical protein